MHTNNPSTEFTISTRIGSYDPIQQISVWEDSVKGGHSSPNTGGSTVVQVDAMPHRRLPFNCHDRLGSYADQEANKPDEKVNRRLAQNREAARKSRLRKKAYVQQLESSRLKLAQMENDLHRRARQQGVYISGAMDTSPIGLSGEVNSGIVSFEMEYARWIDEQCRHSSQLGKALETHIAPAELGKLVETVLNHYDSLFRLKGVVAKDDAFYLMSGMWSTSAERFFFWIGGSRPSELLNVLTPHLDPLTDQQVIEVSNLQKSVQQAEDALSQGMDKLQQSLAQNIAADPVIIESYTSRINDAMETMETMESFVNQADHLRQQTLQQMARILTTRQAARGLLGLGEYFHRLRALSALWEARPRELA